MQSEVIIDMPLENSSSGSDALKCPICFSLLEGASETNCGHSFCGL